MIRVCLHGALHTDLDSETALPVAYAVMAECPQHPRDEMIMHDTYVSAHEGASGSQCLGKRRLSRGWPH